MKSKVPLILMEQIIMVLVFAIAAAVCVQAFVLSDLVSRNGAERDQAVVIAENAAETMKGFRGDGTKAAQQMGGTWQQSDEGGSWNISYDKNWNVTGADPAYTVCVIVKSNDSKNSGLGSAAISVCSGKGTVVYSLNVLWQPEVIGNA